MHRPHRKVSDNLRGRLGGQRFSDFMGHIDIELLEDLNAQTSLFRFPQILDQLPSAVVFLPSRDVVSIDQDVGVDEL